MENNLCDLGEYPNALWLWVYFQGFYTHLNDKNYLFLSKLLMCWQVLGCNQRRKKH